MTVPPQSRHPHSSGDLPTPVHNALHQIQPESVSLAEHAVAHFLQATAGAPSSPRPPVDDITLWLAALDRRAEADQLHDRFRRLVNARRHEHSAGEAVLLQQACATALQRAVLTRTAGQASQSEQTHLATAMNTAIRQVLAIAADAIITVYGSQLAGDAQHDPLGIPHARAVATNLSPLPGSLSSSGRAGARWCLVAHADGAQEAGQATRLLQATNPYAHVTTEHTTLTAFCRDVPVLPDTFPPCGTASTDADREDAVHRASLAARIADYYRLRELDADELAPVLALAQSSPRAQQTFLVACLGPLYLSGNQTDLLHTLRAYLDHNLRVTETAKSLYIHRHTLTDRLRRIQHLTQLDLHHPFHRLRAQLALLLLALQPEASSRLLP
ncbi:PucR family transcriptional regulator [Streptomyces sp. NPDC007808]|uniref:PucR family transcriptional regulator n=1 Tax=Streptomyces sp. NPDC007808 TaxID=3364779 RepID=UPI0036CE5AF7